MSVFKKFVAVAAALVATAAFAEAPDWWTSTLKLKNASGYSVEEFYITPWDELNWGPNLLREDLDPGEAATLTNIECDRYDLKLVDDEGDTCVIQDVDLCLEDAKFSLTDRLLASCTVFEK